MSRALSCLFLFLCASVNAQFGFFDNMFHQQERHQPSGASQWASHLESVPCNRYLCPSTLDCVKSPVDCPCPYVEDIKCTIPDKDNRYSATVVCARGENECEQVKALSHRWSK